MEIFKFEPEYYNAYEAPTKEEWNRIVGWALANGCEWYDRSTGLDTKDWEQNGEDTIIFIDDMTLAIGSRQHLESEIENGNEDYEIKPFPQIQVMHPRLMTNK